MSDEHEMTNPHDAPEETFAESKGKEKAAEDVHDAAPTEDDDDDDDEDEEEAEPEQAEDDGMEAMDLNNVLGRRTRGAQIDFAKAAEDLGPEDEDEEDDDDFQPPAEDVEMAD
ncbi:hypothetical protein PT974_00226 [Cladobotryum mycophilum]|uniref:Histone chaperone domain-containing protein n=1 Tax=Cladobotryum mycophilum TaxID=491253 RepID=A0ABR0T145_9HYPO